MSHKTLFVSVGRSALRPLCTVADEIADQEAQLAAVELIERQNLINGGTAPERIVLSRESGGEDAKPKKGKG